jgi:transcriptional regulator GlxA family with amidase domain
MSQPPLRILLALVPPVDELDLVAPAQVFAIANRVVGRRVYDIELATSGDDLMVESEAGLLTFSAQKRLKDVSGPFDSVLVISGLANRHRDEPALTAWLRSEVDRTRRIGSVCVAGFFLARAGLLDGRHATSHWRFVQEFAECHPQVKVTAAPIWIQDGTIFTSAGVTAGFDLALGWMESDLGAALAAEVARELVVFARRTASDAQISQTLAAQSSERRQLRELALWISENLQKALTAEELADKAGMSRRTLERSFAREIGRPPARFVVETRVAAARRLLNTTSRSLDQVARAVGFRNAEAMRRAFRRVDGSNPRQYRANAIAAPA